MIAAAAGHETLLGLALMLAAFVAPPAWLAYEVLAWS